MKVKDIVGKKVEFRTAGGIQNQGLFVVGEYGVPPTCVEDITRIVIDNSADDIPTLTVYYFETDEEGKLMTEDGLPAKSEKTFSIVGLAELNIVRELKQDDLTDPV